ncbi:methylenetetrahydrofolate reductase [Paraburkholderia sacchari]|uniref:methylenetetrahydrofolate reductase n=1 Tax=Paraburkholderia sacchari TaxID=159450 RepID=UPI003D972A28
MSDQIQLEGGVARPRGAIPSRPANPVLSLIDDFSLEMSGKDQPALQEAKSIIPPDTLINVTFLGNETLDLRVSAARSVREYGFRPVPHIAARRLQSDDQLKEFLIRLQEVGANEQVFAVGGDPATPEGPYDDSLSVIRSGILADHGVKHVSISGYPEGHPDIPGERLWDALSGKYAALTEQGLDSTILTQFGFDADPVVRWISEVRDRGIEAPIRVGVPGPAGVKRLLAFAARFGVASSASVVKKYGLSLTNLFGTAGPDRFIRALAGQLEGKGLGEVGLHFYAFGGLHPTGEWIRNFRKEA